MTDECLICAHAQEHGHWPKEHVGTHCKTCHRSWAAHGECHCGGCHLHFTSLSAFTIHQRTNEDDESYCLDPATMHTKAGKALMHLYQGPKGDAWGNPPPSPEAIERFRRLKEGR